MKAPTAFFVLLALFATPNFAGGDPLSRMPVREVTVFKDGHAFVLHEGAAKVDPYGSVGLDVLPVPVLGTFWPFSAEKGAPLRAVVAGQRRVRTERTPLHLGEFIEANPGARVWVTETSLAPDKEGPRYEATLLGVPERSAEEVEAASPPGSGPKLPERGTVVLLKTGEGTKVVPLARILDLTLSGDPRPGVPGEELRPSLTLRLDWGGRPPSPEARVGLAYLQWGLRWIPSYRVELDGKGTAQVKLQATLVNDLTDLEGVTAHLVIGVPSFAFQGQLDPIALQKEASRVASLAPGSQFARGLSNAIMSQTALGAMNEMDDRPVDSGPQVSGAEKAEDLFVFTVEGVTLKKGERMVLPVAESTFRYRDVYTLDIPALPPGGMTPQRGLSATEVETVRRLASPKVIHRVRWSNTSKEPLTTAPALILSGGRILAQGLMTYAAPGAAEELELTAAVDIPATSAESELRRTPDAARWDGDPYARIDLKGSVRIVNRSGGPAELEVVKRVLGNVDSATEGGAVTKLNLLAEDETGRPSWWSWYSWPHWWNRYNGMGKVTWKRTVEAGQSAELEYAWHYFWR